MSSVRPSAAAAELAAQKRALRAELRARRRAMPNRPAASRVIVANIAALPAFQSAGVVAAFAPLPDEVDIVPLLRAVLADGKTLLLPRIADRARGRLVFHRIADLAALVPGPMNIPEPPPALPVVNPARADFLLVPALAADRQNFRLGYGGGFYDRLLAQLPPAAATCCPLFAIQKIEKVPRDLHDRPTSCIITESDSRPDL